MPSKTSRRQNWNFISKMDASRRCPMAHEALLAELEKRKQTAKAMGGPKKLAKRKERGQLNAEERLNALVDKDSFIELGLLGASGVFDGDVEATPRDGKITGFAK